MVTPALRGEAPFTGNSELHGRQLLHFTLGADGAVTAIEGYTFTGSRAAREAVDGTADATEDQLTICNVRPLAHG